MAPAIPKDLHFNMPGALHILLYEHAHIPKADLPLPASIVALDVGSDNLGPQAVQYLYQANAAATERHKAMRRAPVCASDDLSSIIPNKSAVLENAPLCCCKIGTHCGRVWTLVDADAAATTCGFQEDRKACGFSLCDCSLLSGHQAASCKATHLSSRADCFF